MSGEMPQPLPYVKRKTGREKQLESIREQALQTTKASLEKLEQLDEKIIKSHGDMIEATKARMRLLENTGLWKRLLEVEALQESRRTRNIEGQSNYSASENELQNLRSLLGLV